MGQPDVLRSCLNFKVYVALMHSSDHISIRRLIMRVQNLYTYTSNGRVSYGPNNNSNPILVKTKIYMNE